jgi:hypothetical protein
VDYVKVLEMLSVVEVQIVNLPYVALSSHWSVPGFGNRNLVESQCNSLAIYIFI